MDLAAAAARGLATLSHSTVACLLGSRISAQGAVRTTTPQARTAPRQPLPDAAPLVQHAARCHSLREVLLELEVNKLNISAADGLTWVP